MTLNERVLTNTDAKTTKLSVFRNKR